MSHVSFKGFFLLCFSVIVFAAAATARLTCLSVRPFRCGLLDCWIVGLLDCCVICYCFVRFVWYCLLFFFFFLRFHFASSFVLVFFFLSRIRKRDLFAVVLDYGKRLVNLLMHSLSFFVFCFSHFFLWQFFRKERFDFWSSRSVFIHEYCIRYWLIWFISIWVTLLDGNAKHQEVDLGPKGTESDWIVGCGCGNVILYSKLLALE